MRFALLVLRALYLVLNLGLDLVLRALYLVPNLGLDSRASRFVSRAESRA